MDTLVLLEVAFLALVVAGALLPLTSCFEWLMNKLRRAVRAAALDLD